MKVREVTYCTLCRRWVDWPHYIHKYPARRVIHN